MRATLPVHARTVQPYSPSKILRSACVLLIAVSVGGCGYTTGSLISKQYKTIYVEAFENKVLYGSEAHRALYMPLLETDVRNAIVDRFLFDGNLRVAREEIADLTMKGALTGYERDVLRYTSGNDPEEYRIRIVVSLELWDGVKQKVLWKEPRFVGETTYFTTGPFAKAENTALQDALTDIARRIVERTIEDW